MTHGGLAIRSYKSGETMIALARSVSETLQFRTLLFLDSCSAGRLRRSYLRKAGVHGNTIGLPNFRSKKGNRVKKGLLQYRNGVTLRLLRGALGAALLAAPASVVAQTATIIGYPSNFDTINDTGQSTAGFEIEVDGLPAVQLTRIFGDVTPNTTANGCYIRYCSGAVIPFNGGFYVRWTSPWDPASQTFTQMTPPYNGTVATGESCWTLGLGARYQNAGCEHFGISTMTLPSRVVYRWLVPDPNNSGQLMYYMSTTDVPPGVTPPPPAPTPVYIPQPAIVAIPPVQPAAQPAIDFQIQLPPLPKPPFVAPPQWGDAKWVKVFKSEADNAVDLDDLMAGNPVVPDESQVETPWKLLQSNPSNPNSGVLHSSGTPANGKHAVVRRYEFYKYTGAFDPATHEALCAGAGDCASPLANELGDYIGAQIAAANLDIPSITVTKTGSGTVVGGKINCGGNCTEQLAAGTPLTLTANAPGNALFGGWSGDCTNADPTCNLTVTRPMIVNADFVAVFNLSIGRGGSGTISGTPNGAFGTSIGCGSSCSAKFPVNTAVTLTATPLAGHTFVNWTGACSGTAPTCTLVITKDTTAQANFK